MKMSKLVIGLAPLLLHLVLSVVSVLQFPVLKLSAHVVLVALVYASAIAITLRNELLGVLACLITYGVEVMASTQSGVTVREAMMYWVGSTMELIGVSIVTAAFILPEIKRGRVILWAFISQVIIGLLHAYIVYGRDPTFMFGSVLPWNAPRYVIAALASPILYQVYYREE